MDWVNSTGGPLICGEAHVLLHWGGVSSLSVAMSACKNDYARACEVTDYIEALPCNNGMLLVLGDEPLQSTFFKDKENNFYILRWVYASNAIDTDSVFLNIPANIQMMNSEKMQFHIGRHGLILMDSSLSGKDIDNQKEIYIDSGEYEISTGKLFLERSYDFLVHRFIKCE